MDIKELYQDIILEHGKSPRNFGKCKGHNHEAKGHNPLCGDQVHIYLKLNENKNVEHLTFEGSGCAISIASTSIMTELVKQYPMRVKCATLSWHTLVAAMSNQKKEVNTELVSNE